MLLPFQIWNGTGTIAKRKFNFFFFVSLLSLFYSLSLSLSLSFVGLLEEINVGWLVKITMGFVGFGVFVDGFDGGGGYELWV